jgi:hypothetical protein
MKLCCCVLCTKRRKLAARSLSPFSPLQRRVRQVQINNGFRSDTRKNQIENANENYFPDFDVSPAEP